LLPDKKLLLICIVVLIPAAGPVIKTKTAGNNLLPAVLVFFTLQVTASLSN